jgi:AcrR family transcriptional regulator
LHQASFHQEKHVEQPASGRLEKRRKAMVDAARALFTERGFERTALADVVEQSGGSLATLYKLFGNKAGLLEAIVQEQVRSGESLIEGIAASGLEPAATLHVLGEELQRRILEPQNVAISRIVMAHSLQDAQFASNFLSRTLQRSEQSLSTLFDEWRGSGVPLSGESDVLAAIFLGMFVYDLHAEAISGRPAARVDSQRIEAKIAFFCRGAGLPCR